MFGVFMKKWLPWVVGLLCFFLFFRFTLPMVVKGDSMVPNLFENQRLLVVKNTRIARFDFIIFNDPQTKKPLVKRVIGLPGETIAYTSDQLFVEGEKLAEPFLVALMEALAQETQLTGDIKEQKIPENAYFVLGDNRKISRDSRMFGVIQQEEIIGEAKLSFWPLNQIEWLP
ncbi:signal peptidase I [Enterococcus sp. LJL98]